MGVRVAETIRVLHVDDDPSCLRLVEAQLEQAVDDIEVRTAESGAEALEALEALDADVDCVVSDYQMPETDGLELLDAVREEHPDLPFVLFTGKGSEGIASEAISRGVTDYVRKGGAEQFELLANAVENAAVGYRAQQTVRETRSRAREVVRETRQQARHAIEERRARFQALIENASDVVSILDGEGTIQYASPSSERVLGYRPEELVGKNGFEFVHPEDRDRAMDRFFAGLENPDRLVTVEYRFRTKDGGWRWLESRGRNRLDDSAVEGFVVNSRDTTERREMEATLREERDRFAALYENIPEPVVEYVLRDGEPVVRDVNRAFEEVFGCGKEAAVGESLDDLVVSPDDRERAADLNARVKAGERLDAELDRTTADGRRQFLLRNVPIDDDGPARGYAIYTDLSGVDSFPDPVVDVRATTD